MYYNLNELNRIWSKKRAHKQKYTRVRGRIETNFGLLYAAFQSQYIIIRSV